MHIPHQSNFYFFKKYLQNTVFHKILLAGWRISGVQCFMRQFLFNKLKQ